MKRAVLMTVLTWISCTAVQAADCPQPDAADNLAAAQQFLQENKDREGIVTTGSGLQYKLLQPGKGKKTPRSRGTVVAHYDLYNIKGEKLESTRDQRAPFQFSVHTVIAGWQEALLDMTEGERRMLFVPPHLAYGCRGSAPNIGANELLIFDMELLHVLR